MARLNWNRARKPGKVYVSATVWKRIHKKNLRAARRWLKGNEKRI